MVIDGGLRQNRIRLIGRPRVFLPVALLSYSAQYGAQQYDRRRDIMSFARTLATLAIGFAAAKGVQKVKKMGGMDGVREAMRQAGDPGGFAD